MINEFSGLSSGLINAVFKKVLLFKGSTIISKNVLLLLRNEKKNDSKHYWMGFYNYFKKTENEKFMSVFCF